MKGKHLTITLAPEVLEFYSDKFSTARGGMNHVLQIGPDLLRAAIADVRTIVGDKGSKRLVKSLALQPDAVQDISATTVLVKAKAIFDRREMAKLEALSCATLELYLLAAQSVSGGKFRWPVFNGYARRSLLPPDYLRKYYGSCFQDQEGQGVAWLLTLFANWHMKMVSRNTGLLGHAGRILDRDKGLHRVLAMVAEEPVTGQHQPGDRLKQVLEEQDPGLVPVVQRLDLPLQALLEVPQTQEARGRTTTVSPSMHKAPLGRLARLFNSTPNSAVAWGAEAFLTLAGQEAGDVLSGFSNLEQEFLRAALLQLGGGHLDPSVIGRPLYSRISRFCAAQSGPLSQQMQVKGGLLDKLQKMTAIQLALLELHVSSVVQKEDSAVA